MTDPSQSIATGPRPPSLFEPPPSQPHSATSRAAAQKIKPAVAEQRRRVLAAIVNAGAAGLTDQEGEVITGIAGNSYRPRRGQLAKAGMIRTAGRRRTESGNSAAVWVAVDRGAA